MQNYDYTEGDMGPSKEVNYQSRARSTKGEASLDWNHKEK